MSFNLAQKQTILGFESIESILHFEVVVVSLIKELLPLNELRAKCSAATRHEVRDFGLQLCQSSFVDFAYANDLVKYFRLMNDLGLEVGTVVD